MKPLKSVIGKTLRNTIGPQRTSSLERRVRDMTILPRNLITPEGRHSAQVLAKLKNRYNGRCVIIGNGPSLNRTDISRLRTEITFGLNRIYLMFEKRDFRTSFLVSVNPLVIEQCAVELVRQPCITFLGWTARQYIEPRPHVALLQSAFTPLFSKHPVVRGVYEGFTVTYVAMQLAFFMGFREVVLVGVDHTFSTKGRPNTPVTSTGRDPDHFDPNYFGPGFKWHLPDLKRSEIAYGIANETFRRAGGKILDATVDGKLEVFEKVDFEDVFPKTRP